MLNTIERQYALSVRSARVHAINSIRIAIVLAIVSGCILTPAQADPIPIGGGYSIKQTEQTCQEEMAIEVHGPNFFSPRQGVWPMLVRSFMLSKCPQLAVLHLKGITAGKTVYAGSMKSDNGWNLEDTGAPSTTLIAIHEINLKAPYGIQIGDRVADVHRKLSAQGLRRNSCNWKLASSMPAELSIKVHVISPGDSNDETCRDDSIVIQLNVSQTELRPDELGRLPERQALANEWQKQLGATENACAKPYRQGMTPGVRCEFEYLDREQRPRRLSVQYAQHKGVSTGANFKLFDAPRIEDTTPSGGLLELLK